MCEAVHEGHSTVADPGLKNRRSRPPHRGASSRSTPVRRVLRAGSGAGEVRAPGRLINQEFSQLWAWCGSACKDDNQARSWKSEGQRSMLIWKRPQSITLNMPMFWPSQINFMWLSVGPSMNQTPTSKRSTSLLSVKRHSKTIVLTTVVTLQLLYHSCTATA